MVFQAFSRVACKIQVLVYGPDVLASIGLNDATATNDFILNNLNLFHAQLYVKAVATRVTPPQDSGAPGNNIRLDFYIYYGPLRNQLRYVGSLEVLEIVIDVVRGLREVF